MKSEYLTLLHDYASTYDRHNEVSLMHDSTIKACQNLKLLLLDSEALVNGFFGVLDTLLGHIDKHNELDENSIYELHKSTKAYNDAALEAIKSLDYAISILSLEGIYSSLEARYKKIRSSISELVTYVDIQQTLSDASAISREKEFLSSLHNEIIRFGEIVSTCSVFCGIGREYEKLLKYINSAEYIDDLYGVRDEVSKYLSIENQMKEIYALVMSYENNADSSKNSDFSPMFAQIMEKCGLATSANEVRNIHESFNVNSVDLINQVISFLGGGDFKGLQKKATEMLRSAGGSKASSGLSDVIAFTSEISAHRSTLEDVRKYIAEAKELQTKYSGYDSLRKKLELSINDISKAKTLSAVFNESDAIKKMMSNKQAISQIQDRINRIQSCKSYIKFYSYNRILNDVRAMQKKALSEKDFDALFVAVNEASLISDKLGENANIVSTLSTVQSDEHTERDVTFLKSYFVNITKKLHVHDVERVLNHARDKLNKISDAKTKQSSGYFHLEFMHSDDLWKKLAGNALILLANSAIVIAFWPARYSFYHVMCALYRSRPIVEVDTEGDSDSKKSS